MIHLHCKYVKLKNNFPCIRFCLICWYVCVHWHFQSKNLDLIRWSTVWCCFTTLRFCASHYGTPVSVCSFLHRSMVLSMLRGFFSYFLLEKKSEWNIITFYCPFLQVHVHVRVWKTRYFWVGVSLLTLTWNTKKM